MSNNILTFIDEPSITTFTPSVGFAGTQFTIQGDNLEDAETIYFIEAITNVSYFATFQKIDSGGSTVIQGTVPDIDSTKRDYIVRIENSFNLPESITMNNNVVVTNYKKYPIILEVEGKIVADGELSLVSEI